MTTHQISNNINKMFQDLFISNVHPFFNDIKKVLDLKKEYNEKIKNAINKEYEYKEHSKIINIESLNINNIKDYDELDIKDMNKLLKEINNVLNYNKILD
jgi:hypothetical protein